MPIRELSTLEQQVLDIFSAGQMNTLLVLSGLALVALPLAGIGIYGIILEFWNPGFYLPGVVGGICLLLAFYSLGMLPVNYVGVLFIVLAFGMFIGEVLLLFTLTTVVVAVRTAMPSATGVLQAGT